MLRLNGRVIRGVAANADRMSGTRFEAEIREQPEILRRIAASGVPQRLHAAVGDRDVLFTGSGSSFFVAQLAALKWRGPARRALAVAASEARFSGAAARDTCVVALSQSGRSGDVLDAVDALAGSTTIALTNDPSSPLAERADVAIDMLAGTERAVPASKSVTAMAAIVLMCDVPPAALTAAANEIGAWLDGCASRSMETVAAAFDATQSIVVLGAGFGVPVADEIALKIKEATYRHAEGFGAGEFRHGSTAMLDGVRGAIGIVDPWSAEVVGDVLSTARAASSVTATIGGAVAGSAAYGPAIAGTFAPLGWIVTGQMLALAFARRAGIDSDVPRGLLKFLR
jgi:glucosamine--fructose-6-phosphate aminotransferase (isomerizing)